MEMLEIERLPQREVFPGFLGRFVHASTVTLAHDSNLASMPFDLLANSRKQCGATTNGENASSRMIHAGSVGIGCESAIMPIQATVPTFADLRSVVAVESSVRFAKPTWTTFGSASRRGPGERWLAHCSRIAAFLAEPGGRGGDAAPAGGAMGRVRQSG